MNPTEEKKQAEQEKILMPEQESQSGEEKKNPSEQKRQESEEKMNPWEEKKQGEEKTRKSPKHCSSKSNSEPTVELLNKSVAKSSHNLLGRTGLKVSKVK